MNMYPTSTKIRSHLSHQFFTLRANARRDSLWAKLMGKQAKLAIFPEEARENSRDRKFLGTEYISVEQIVGTIRRHSDFDHKFRPLNKQLLDHWVNVYLTLERDGWSPILVHKVGENYYVEDGHYRVSIALALGKTFVRAEVWEYPFEEKETSNCQPEPCPEISSAKIYSGVTE